MRNVSVVFLDRDGVINYRRPDHVKSIEEFEFIEGSREAVLRLNKAGCLVIVITNQSVVGRGLISEPELAAIHDYMVSRIEEMGGRIDAIYYCPHKPDDNCECRKPAPGLFKRAASEFKIELKDSFFVGDNPTDYAAGDSVGVRTILVRPNSAGELLRAVDRVSDAFRRQADGSDWSKVN
jgi:histidinol-phosphate phosphatase family protein